MKSSTATLRVLRIFRPFTKNEKEPNLWGLDSRYGLIPFIKFNIRSRPSLNLWDVVNDRRASTVPIPSGAVPKVTPPVHFVSVGS